MATLQLLFVLSAASLSVALPALQYPIHASCEIKWTWPSTTCAAVAEKLIAAAKTMQGTTGCDNGGEKCLYTIKSQSATKLTLTHETPAKHYKDDLTINLSPTGSAGCKGDGQSTSETWYAYLDDGTNYCNLENLLTAAGLDKESAFQESTSDSVCTQYSSRNCGKY